MKKMLLILTSLLFSVVTIGCIPIPNIRENMLNASNEEKIADERMKEIITALENKDRKALKAMFSEKAKEDAVDLDEGIEHIINFYQGKMISFDGTVDVEEKWINGKKKTIINPQYTIKTDMNVYEVYFEEIQSTTSSDENGVYRIYILEKERGRYKHFTKSTILESAGVFIYDKDKLKPYDYFSGIVRILGNSDKDFLKELFSQNAIYETGGLEDSIKNAIDLFQGHMESSKEIETTVEKDGDNIVTKGYYEVTTKNHFNKPEEAGTYLIYFVHKRNEVDLDEDGLYTLEIAEKVDENTELSRIDKAGIIVS